MSAINIDQPQIIQDRAFEFACRIVKLHRFLCRNGSTSSTIAGQILRSGTSIGANLEEASAGQSKPDFTSKCNIALKEARETYYWIRLLTACELVPKKKLEPLLVEANEIVAILTTIVKKSRLSQT